MGVSKVLKIVLLNYQLKRMNGLVMVSKLASIEILISKYGFGPVKLLELSTNGPQVTHGFCDDQSSLGYLL